MTTAPPARRAWMTRNLVVLSWVSLFQDTASELLYPILPIFLVGVLGAPIAIVGITEGLADGAASLTKIASGRLADRGDRRGLVGLGYGLAAAAKIVIAMAFVWPIVLVARVVDRIGKGIRGAPRDALIADATPAQYRGRAFGFHRAIDTTGAVIGPLLGLGLYNLLDEEIRPLLVIAAVPAVLSVFLVRFVRDPRRSGEGPTPSALPSSPSPGSIGDPADPAARPALPVHFWRVTGLITLFGLVNFSDALLLVRAGHLGLSVSGVIAVYCLYNATYAALSYPAGAASDRLPRRVVFAVGLLVFSGAYLALGFGNTSTIVWIVFPLYGAFTALTDGVGKAWIVDLVPATQRGRALGLQQGLAGGATILAGLWAGLAWQGTGRGPLVVSGAIAGALAVVLLSSGAFFDTRKA